jgi:hemerythrin
MSIHQTLQKEIEESKRWIKCTQEDSTYRRDLYRRIELINWVLEEIKNPDIQICAIIETRMNELIDEINKKDSIIEADPLDSEARILDWILYIICSNEIRQI